jgi:hypothetical protein
MSARASNIVGDGMPMTNCETPDTTSDSDCEAEGDGLLQEGLETRYHSIGSHTQFTLF